MRGTNLPLIHLSENTSSEKKPGLRSGGKNRAQREQCGTGRKNIKLLMTSSGLKKKVSSQVMSFTINRCA